MLEARLSHSPLLLFPEETDGCRLSMARAPAMSRACHDSWRSLPNDLFARRPKGAPGLDPLVEVQAFSAAPIAELPTYPTGGQQVGDAGG
jgi:hypothetical protein